MMKVIENTSNDHKNLFFKIKVNNIGIIDKTRTIFVENFDHQLYPHIQR